MGVGLTWLGDIKSLSHFLLKSLCAMFGTDPWLLPSLQMALRLSLLSFLRLLNAVIIGTDHASSCLFFRLLIILPGCYFLLWISVFICLFLDELIVLFLRFIKFWPSRAHNLYFDHPSPVFNLGVHSFHCKVFLSFI